MLRVLKFISKVKTSFYSFPYICMQEGCNVLKIDKSLSLLQESEQFIALSTQVFLALTPYYSFYRKIFMVLVEHVVSTYLGSYFLFGASVSIILWCVHVGCTLETCLVYFNGKESHYLLSYSVYWWWFKLYCRYMDDISYFLLIILDKWIVSKITLHS